MNALVFALLVACGATPHDHDHPEGHDGDHVHHEEGDHHEGHDAEGAAIEAPLGSFTARLVPSADALELVVLDGGEPVAAEGEARVMLTGTGGEAQRVVLAPSGSSWKGAAKAAGAPGYVAVVQVAVGGHTESARLTWGTVPEAAPAPEPEDHGGDGHDHGDGGHAHDHGSDHEH